MNYLTPMNIRKPSCQLVKQLQCLIFRHVASFANLVEVGTVYEVFDDGNAV